MAKRALGKGLSALLKDSPASSPAPERPREETLEAEFVEGPPAPTMLGDREALLLPCDQIEANPSQPRKQMDRNALEELSASIRQNGILQPILVRRVDGRYELVAGERRLRATQMAGIDEIPALVCSLEEQESLKLALLENIQRENLNAIEEAEAYRAILEAYGATHQEVADMLGKNRSTVSNMLRLLTLEDVIRAQLSGGNLSMGHARALLALEDSEQRIDLAGQTAKNGLSVREVERRVATLMGAGKKRRRSAGRVSNDPDAAAVREFEDRLRNHLGSPVKIVRRGKKGRIEISFFSDDELQGVLEKMGVDPQL